MNHLLACRVCLAYDTRLCSIKDGQFRYIYEKLVEASLDTEDMLPTSVCYICFALMKKMLQFRHSSQKANQILQHMICSGLEPSVSSLDMLVKNQTGIAWTLGKSDIERTTTTSGEVEFEVRIESVKSEVDIDGMSDRNEDYFDIVLCRDSTSDFEDDLTLASQQCKTEFSGHEGAAPPEKRMLQENEEENKLVNIQTPLIKTEKDEEPRTNLANKEDKTKKIYFKKVEMTTSNIITDIQNQSTFNKNDTVTPPKDTNFTCDLCINEYQCKILLESHKKTSHAMEFTRKDSITSDLNAANECKSTNLLKTQEIQNKDSRKGKVRRENKFREKTSHYECTYCMKIFTRNFELTRHLRVHTKEKPFRCDICEKCFINSSHLTIHLRVHTKEKPFKCDLCGKCFAGRSTLANHLRVHTREKPYKCDICEKCFALSSSLSTHLRVHTKEKPFKCDICEKGFSQRGHLTKHLKVHTKEKPYKCDICDKCFAERSTIINHLRVHTKEKPYKCKICEKGFSQSAHLTAHLKVHTKEKSLKCDICEKCFRHRHHLTTHKRIHSGEKAYSCSYCDKRFSDRRNFNSHLKSHTRIIRIVL